MIRVTHSSSTMSLSMYFQRSTEPFSAVAISNVVLIASIRAMAFMPLQMELKVDHVSYIVPCIFLS